jgi:hypothetical protein
VDGSSSKETSSRRSCREGDRPQSLEVASLLKLVATNVLFLGLTLGQFARRKPGSYIGDMRQNSPSVADPRTAGISRTIDSREGNSGKQTTKEIQ